MFSKQIIRPFGLRGLAIILFAFVWRGQAASSTDWRTLQIVAHCTILNFKGEVLKQFPGAICAFLPDGRFVSGTTSELAMYDASEKKLWAIPGHFHHQVNLSQDKKTILALSSLSEFKDKKMIRKDRFLRISLEGKILGDSNSGVLFSHFAIDKGVSGVNFKNAGAKEGPVLEGSHFNSIHEIPSNKLAQSNPAFREGNVIVNDVSAGVFIFSKDLSKPLFMHRHKLPIYTHDTQVNEKGNLIYFNNEQVGTQSNLQGGPYSGVEEINPLTGKMIYQFFGRPKEIFYSACCGGVQELDNETLLISHMTNGFFVLNRKSGQIIYSSGKTTTFQGGETSVTVTQQYRAENLLKFLAAWGIKQ